MPRTQQRSIQLTMISLSLPSNDNSMRSPQISSVSNVRETSWPPAQFLGHQNREVNYCALEYSEEVHTRQLETILARLDPIERAIMAIPARTIAGLGVKARHAAYVVSQYWEEPVDQIDWEAKAVRLLIEAVCEVARMPLPFRNLRVDE
jgi:hypothetical protein